MIITLWKKYDIWTIMSFLCLGFIFGLNGCVQSSILINFYEPKIICKTTSLHSINQNYSKKDLHYSHSTHSILNNHIIKENLGNYQAKETCNPCQEGYKGDILLKKDRELYSMVEQFQWYCLKEYQKIIVMSMMASGLFIGFLTNFLIGDSQKINKGGIDPISQKSMIQILVCLYIQTTALLLSYIVQQWYQAGFILAVWNFGYSFFYSSIYSFIGQKYGTLIVKYSSTIYHFIWSLVMIGFLVFIRFFGDWRDIQFFFSGIPQFFFLICLTIAIYAQKRKQQSNSSLKKLSSLQQEQNILTNKNISTEDNVLQQIELNSDPTEFKDDSVYSQGNQQQTFILSRFQTEDFLLSVQVNQSANDIDNHNGSIGGVYYGGQNDQVYFNTYQKQDSYSVNEHQRGSDQDSIKRHSHAGGKNPTGKNQIFENLKQKMYINDLTQEQLKQQQEQFIINSDLNVIDANYSISANTSINVQDNLKITKPNLYYQSQLIQNTNEAQESSETLNNTQNTVKYSHNVRDNSSQRQLYNNKSRSLQPDDEGNLNSPHLPAFNISNNSIKQEVFYSGSSIQIGRNELRDDSFNLNQKPIIMNNNQHQQVQRQTSILSQLQPSINQTNTNNISAIKQEMRMRWLQLKRDPSQKLNILIFLCCWITANITNYGIYFSLLFVEGDIYVKITICVIIEIISNYIASFILVRYQLKRVILSLFFLSGCMLCATFWMEKTTKRLLFPLFITKICMEIFFPIKTYFLQFVLHSQYFKISLGLGDTLSTLFQALIPLLTYISYSNQGFFLSYLGILLIFCVLMIFKIEMINIYGLNQQFSQIMKGEKRQSNLQELAEIMEVDSAADISLYSIQSPRH